MSMIKETKSIIARQRDLPVAESAGWSPGGDLWRYAPVRDLEGRALSDLMMLLPVLQDNRHLSILIREELQDVLEGFGERIVFANLNLRLGIFWVTVASEPGLCGEVADAIKARILGARTVCNYVQSKQPERIAWSAKFRRLLSLPKMLGGDQSDG
ncbi:MAG: hypothetical protein PVG22_01800 [Chromatiales bacterium]|jgi:hypothetical protein